MPHPFPAATEPLTSNGLPLGCAGPVPQKILAEPGPVPGVDFVPTVSVPVEVLPSKGSNRQLRAGQVLMAARGWALRERIIQLHCFEGKNLKQCARLLGRSYKRVSAHWAAICRDVNGSADSTQHKEAVRTYLDRHFRRVMEESQSLLGEAAAYGAVVVAAGKALAELHGIKPEDVLPTGFSLEDVGREVRVVSPLLMDKMDRVKALCGPSVGSSEGGRAAANARWAKVVPVEGSPVGLGGVESG